MEAELRKLQCMCWLPEALVQVQTLIQEVWGRQGVCVLQTHLGSPRHCWSPDHLWVARIWVFLARAWLVLYVKYEGWEAFESRGNVASDLFLRSHPGCSVENSREGSRRPVRRKRAPSRRDVAGLRPASRPEPLQVNVRVCSAVQAGTYLVVLTCDLAESGTSKALWWFGEKKIWDARFLEPHLPHPWISFPFSMHVFLLS